MAVDPQIAGIAARTPNFGFLLDHEPLLVVYGAEAESFVFTTPNTSMIKSRQFGEALVNALLAAFGITVPSAANTFHKRLKVLADQGVVNQRVHGWFNTVRDTGNKAAHEGYAAQQDALRLVRACYELGAWFHRLSTDSGDAAVRPAAAAQPAATARRTRGGAGTG